MANDSSPPPESTICLHAEVRPHRIAHCFKPRLRLRKRELPTHLATPDDFWTGQLQYFNGPRIHRTGQAHDIYDIAFRCRIGELYLESQARSVCDGVRKAGLRLHDSLCFLGLDHLGSLPNRLESIAQSHVVDLPCLLPPDWSTTVPPSMRCNNECPRHRVRHMMKCAST